MRGWVLVVVVVAACGDEPEDSGAAASPRLADLPPPACLDHAYLPLDGMGDLTHVEYAPELSFDPAGLESLLEVLEHPELGPITYGVDTWKVRYVTQDRGVATEATGLVVVPREVEGETPLVMWLHPTTGTADLCAPSALGVLGSGLPLVWAGRTGAVVAAPDYIGMAGVGATTSQLHPYIVGEPTAIASLDMARAALAFAEQEQTAARPDPARTVLWGASQGGHAALWADRYQRGYAPELAVAAVVAAVPPTDLVALAERGVSEWTDTSETLVAVAATHADWYGLDLGDVLTHDLAESVPVVLDTTCDALDPAGDVDVLEEVFTAEALAWPTTGLEASLPGWACAFEASSLAGSVIPRGEGAPVQLILGEADTLAWAPAARADAEALCEQGYDIALTECAGLDHEDAAFSTLDAQVAWIEARLAGEPLADACALPGPVDCLAE